MSEFTNIFHTLHTKLGIKDIEEHLVLKYHVYLHKYIQEEIEFLNISSLGTAYRYAVKVEQKFKQKKWYFGSVNLKQGKGAPKPQNKGQSQGGMSQDNPLLGHEYDHFVALISSIFTLLYYIICYNLSFKSIL